MKKSYLTLVCTILSIHFFAQGVTIGSNNPPDPSAVLDLQSTTKGLLIPRMSTQNRNGIVNPAHGLEIYNTTTDCLEIYLPITGWTSVVCDCQGGGPSSAFTFPNSISQGLPATFVASTPGMNYNWVFQSGSPGTSAQQTESVTWPVAGTYTVTLTVTDNIGCSSTTTQQVNVSSCVPFSQSFTPCGAIGRSGPDQNQCNNTYGPGVVSVNNGIQYWTVPQTGTYRIEAAGAQGAPVSLTTGGLGAIIQGEFNLTAGEIIHILVGQQGEFNSNRQYLSSPGGGGSFVVRAVGNNILVIAGGGGGTGNERPSLSNAVTTTNGNNSSTSATGGTNGNGGTSGTTTAGAGGGYLTNGVTSGASGGYAYVNGGAGGVINASYALLGGGFGGGGSITSGANSRYGGGGGYSGGGGSSSLSGATTGLWGGGGGSLNNGSNPVDIGGANGGHGYVTITFICP